MHRSTSPDPTANSALDRPQRILILLAHPSLERSEVNRPLAEAVRDLDGVTLVDLYAEYPDSQIDIDREQQRLLDHDVIIFQHPLYWYSTPAILKEWQDLVLEYGFAYGSKGTALRGKRFFSALSAGGPEAAYQSDGFNNLTIRELLQPLEQMANLCGMVYLPPFCLFGARTAVEEARITQHVDDWLRLLAALRDGSLDLEAARRAPKLNAALDALAEAG
jgi:putative NADPH-quinone reductase